MEGALNKNGQEIIINSWTAMKNIFMIFLNIFPNNCTIFRNFNKNYIDFIPLRNRSACNKLVQA